MRNATGRTALAALMLSLAGLAPAAQAEGKDPALGNWKMRPEKSTYTPGPAPKDIVTKFEMDGAAIKNTTKFIDAKGQKSTMVYSAPIDGKDYPITGSKTSDTISLKKLSDGSVQRTDKKNGKPVFTLVRTVAKDGKTMTVVQKGVDPKTPFENVMVFDRK